MTGISPWYTLVLLAAFATVATAAPATKPTDRRIIGVLDIRVEGVAPEVQAQFVSGLEAQLDSKRYWLVGRAKLRERMLQSTKWTEGCLVGPCLAEIKAQAGAEVSLLVAMTGSGTSFGYVVTLVRSDSGSVLSQQSDRCDVCTVNEVMTKATLATIELLAAIPDKLPDEKAARRLAIEAALRPERAKVDEINAEHHRVGLRMTILGILVAAVGTVVYFAEDHTRYGLAIAGGGAGMALGGIAVLTF